MYGSKEVSACVERVRAGESIADVSRDTGISDSAISKWCRSAGVKPARNHYKAWTTGDVRTMRKMWADGAKSEDIAKTLGRTISSVEGFARTHRELCPPRRGGLRYLKERAEELELENARLRKLLAEHGIEVGAA